MSKRYETMRNGNIYCSHPYRNLRIGNWVDSTHGVRIECECGMLDEFHLRDLD